MYINVTVTSHDRYAVRSPSRKYNVFRAQLFWNMRQRQLSSKPVSRKKGTMNPAEEGRFDDVLLPMLSYLGKMDSFLEHIFNFLHRRTDFYRIMKSETDTMGFMPGVSEKLVRNVSTGSTQYVMLLQAQR